MLRPFRFIAGALGAAFLQAACSAHGDPVASDDRGGPPVSFAIAAALTAAPGAVVEATVSYVRPGTEETVTLGTGTLTTGASETHTLPLSANVSACLSDAAGARTTCRVALALRMLRDGRLLDERTQQFDVTANTRTIQVPAIELFEVQTVTITPATLTGLEPGDSQALVATARDRSGTTVPDRTVTWSVVSGSVTVSPAGVVQAVGPGEARVRAVAGGRSGELTFTVGQPSVASVQIAPLDTTVLTGGTVTYRVVARSAAGEVLTGRPITLTSSNLGVATVSGLVATSVGVGQTTITARSTQGRNGATISATTTLRVDAPPPILVDRGTVDFEGLSAGSSGDQIDVAVTTSPGKTIGALRTTVTYTPAVTPWLTATLTSTTTPSILRLQPATGSLPPGAYAADVRLTSATDPHQSATVRVTMQVLALEGRFSGVVLNAVNASPIPFAIVTFRRGDGSVAGVDTTNSSGRYTSDPLPAGTYTITFEAEGYQLSALVNQSLAGGPDAPVTTLPTAQVVPTGSGSGVITGSIRDATTNLIIPTATLELRAGGGNLTGPIIATTTSTQNGSYSFSAQPSGTYTIRGTKVGFADGSVIVTVPGAPTTAPLLFMSPGSSTNAWRAVLSWGQVPEDLDAHLTGPLAATESRFHVYFSAKGSLTTSPFARLDIDAVDGYGPETITIAQQIAGVYRYYVRNFSLEAPLSSSGARVDLYKGNTLVQQYFVPQGSGTVWTVFEINGNDVTPVNTLGTVAPPLVQPAASSGAAPTAAVSGRVPVGPLATEWRRLFQGLPAKTPGSRR